MVGAVFLIASQVDGLGDSVDCDEYRFDSDAWHSQTGQARFRNGPRTEQAEGLLECEVLIGVHRSEVRRLLGPPQRLVSTPRGWSYVVGQGLADPLRLNLDFDRNGRVGRAYLL